MRRMREFRERLTAFIPNMFLRPEMFGRGYGLEFFYRSVLSDLAFIDERDEAYTAWSDSLESNGAYCSTGTLGRLEMEIPNVGRLHCELASIFADCASRLDWMSVGRQCTDSECSALRTFLKHEASKRDWRASEIVSRFGSPSFELGRRVHCYASRDRNAGWICFDYHNEIRRWKDKDGYHYTDVYGDDPILRNTRCTFGYLSAGIQFTPEGRRVTGPKIRRTRGKAGGYAFIRDTQIPVWKLIKQLRAGRDPMKIAHDIPDLRDGDVDAAWDYYRRHPAKIDQLIAAEIRK